MLSINPKALWSHIKNENRHIGLTILQKQFSSVFTREQKGEIPLLGHRTESSIFHFNVTEEIIRNELLNLNASKSCGPDEIHPRLLKELAATISKPIAFVFNKSMQYGKVSLVTHLLSPVQSIKKVREIEREIIVQLA